MANRAARSRDADESSAEDSSSEDECSASEKEDEEHEEEAGEAGSSSDVDLRDHPRRDEEAGSPDPWDNGPVAPPLAPNPISQRPRRTPLRGSWTAMGSHASCLAMRPPPGHWLLPRRQARARVVPPALAQHHSTRKACHYSRRFLVPIHPRNGILLILLIIRNLLDF